MTNQVLSGIRTAPYVVGMDLGGTKILAAIVDAEGRILAEAKRATKASEGPDAVIQRMAQTLVEQLLDLMPELEGVGPWPAVGKSRLPSDYGQVVNRRMPDDLFGDGGDAD